MTRTLYACIAAAFVIALGCGDAAGTASADAAAGDAASGSQGTGRDTVYPEEDAGRDHDAGISPPTTVGRPCDADPDCDDGVYCNGDEVCSDAICAAGDPPEANDGIGCTRERCDEGMRAIVHEPAHADCDDGKFCDGKERCDVDDGCVEGTLTALDDGFACTEDACDEATDQITHTPDDAACDDSDACTIDRCDRDAGCVSEHDGTACPCVPDGDCNPFAADPCPTDQACRPGGSGTTCGAVNAPALGEGDACPTFSDRLRCGAGLMCVDFGDGSKCRRMCPADSVGLCGAALACYGAAITPDGCVKFCRPFAEPCDVLAQDCTDPADTCTFASHPETGERYTGCRLAGPRQRGEACGGASGTCGHRLVCVSGVCREVCDPGDGDPGCTASGEACTGLSLAYDVPFCE